MVDLGAAIVGAELTLRHLNPLFTTLASISVTLERGRAEGAGVEERRDPAAAAITARVTA